MVQIMIGQAEKRIMDTSFYTHKINWGNTKIFAVVVVSTES